LSTSAPSATSAAANSATTAAQVASSASAAATAQAGTVSISGATAADAPDTASLTPTALQSDEDGDDSATDLVAGDPAIGAPSLAQTGDAAKPATALKPDPKSAAAAAGSVKASGPAAEAAALDAILAAKVVQAEAQFGPSGGDKTAGSAASDGGAAPANADVGGGAPAAPDGSAVVLPATTTASNLSATTAGATGANGSAIVSQIASQIAAKTQGKSTSFDIALDPAGLGRVDVQVRIDSAGQVSASMSFSSPQSAAAAQAHAADLHHALEQAGFSVGQGGLSFDVGGQAGGFARQDSQAQNPGASRMFIDASNDLITSPSTRRSMSGASGLDITI
jgi:flagellar hook-length control protein FliK